MLTAAQRRRETLGRDVGHRVGDWNIGLLELENKKCYRAVNHNQRRRRLHAALT